MNAPAKVDVLAVIRELRLRFQNCRELAGFDEPSDLFGKADAAIVAVAELIEIQRRLVAWNRNANGEGSELGQICLDAENALARVQGGAK